MRIVCSDPLFLKLLVVYCRHYVNKQCLFSLFSIQFNMLENIKLLHLICAFADSTKDKPNINMETNHIYMVNFAEQTEGC